MDNKLHSLFILNHDPMLGIRDNKIIAFNPPAEELFGQLYSGKSAISLVPDVLLLYNTSSFAASVEIGTTQFSVNSSHIDNMLVLVFSDTGAKNALNNLANDMLVGSMLSSLCDEKLAIDCVASRLEENSDEKLKSYLTSLYHNYFLLQHSIINLHTALAISRGTLSCSIMELDLAALCSDTASTISYVLRDYGISLEFSTELGELLAYMDAQKIERLLLNLLSNSYAHTPRGGQIRVGLSVQGNNAVISVSDNGCGIDPEAMQTIFTAYENKADLSRIGKNTGGGLGLGIASGIAQKHHGSLIIESRPKSGTTVRVLLPLGTPDLVTFRNQVYKYASSEIDIILTELSPLLDRKYYAPEYMN